MSIARGEFLRSLEGINEAISLEYLAQGATQTTITPGVFVLRRGILISSLIALETFVRDRTVEALRTLERWPLSYEDLPEKLRIAARLNALSNLQQFAKMLKRQEEDFELELRTEISKMASGHGTVQQFSKFVAGDYTGNISDLGLKDLLSSLQVADCWNTFRTFVSDAGIGVPSVQELVKGIVRKRHRSAHSASYSPNAGDIVNLSTDLLCVGLCFDASVSSSMEQSLFAADQWSDGKCKWRDGVNLYFAEPYNRRVRVLKSGQARAFRIANDLTEAKLSIPRATPGQISLLIERDMSGRPVKWDIM
ncbi:hypothetical protein [Methylobacterium sp. Leaf108]|uniref:hypothetical protein n=1 Tax=Methylobacterium sp. Leaf108 TaxID=1736256 RepID=UPI000A7C0345|nr:hypothetical protein [Methylobacterium sp. Leaf108]